MNLSHQPKAILFDLDGTLIDSAPDLGGTIIDMQQARGLPTHTIDQLRPYASAGARGLVGKGFGIAPNHVEFEALKTEFLNRYEQRLAQSTALFDGVEPLLTWLREQRIAWGIVTNKHQRFTLPLISAIGLDKLCQVTICGDTTPHSKPHPEPCLEAARRLSLAPERCWFVGDDERDIQAGQAAGMSTVATAYGYCGSDKPINEWGADVIVHSIDELFDLIRQHHSP